MELIIVKNYEEMSQKAALIFEKQIKENPKSVLGLATGGTPERMYELLIESNKIGNIDFKDIKTFNLDEYIGIPKKHKMSYHTYMDVNFFSKININKENTHIPNGNGDIAENGSNYDKQIENVGGIDLQVLGIGENAHIAFNEPSSSGVAGTREVKLTESTIKANARYFESIDDVPKSAITMGIDSILKADKIILIASGFNKAKAIFDTINHSISKDVPSSFLQNHKNVTLIVDEAAASLLNKN